MFVISIPIIYHTEALLNNFTASNVIFFFKLEAQEGILLIPDMKGQKIYISQKHSQNIFLKKNFIVI